MKEIDLTKPILFIGGLADGQRRTINAHQAVCGVQIAAMKKLMFPLSELDSENISNMEPSCERQSYRMERLSSDVRYFPLMVEAMMSIDEAMNRLIENYKPPLQ